ncbi:MAG: hypothetical protein MUD12_13675 [Spirochaetes bacterium]|jgi:hypothetical protein|nr:hypothetical protein [Spirochaetota bacterium]
MIIKEALAEMIIKTLKSLIYLGCDTSVEPDLPDSVKMNYSSMTGPLGFKINIYKKDSAIATGSIERDESFAFPTAGAYVYRVFFN